MHANINEDIFQKRKVARKVRANLLCKTLDQAISSYYQEVGQRNRRFEYVDRFRFNLIEELLGGGLMQRVEVSVEQTVQAFMATKIMVYFEQFQK